MAICIVIPATLHYMSFFPTDLCIVIMCQNVFISKEVITKTITTMKYIIIKGSKSSGKAETINAICRKLKPEAIRKLYFHDTGKIFMEQVPPSANICEGTYLVTVRKKNILMVANCPTEQRKRISQIMDSVLKLNITPHLAIVAMRGLEKLKDFATAKELENYGKCIYETKIWRIPSNQFSITDEWNKRISYITAITMHNI